MDQMKVKMNLSSEEWRAALSCIERRYNELKRKLAEGERKGRSIRNYREESLLLERVLDELKNQE
ncbi:hypothetical protein GCM10007416_29230 [Kroppenstedtia guangzhouensis]|uniref:Uncharacterized protein n=1 Tax=Kroppenstedtia guangzhouensis TaxID=1274356 RepID=A0ABQ1H144_9BACL|nr:hypothetical protein [Kroppenstedtia guangzhouensis]GGA54195.1 hypothetical protein GCM10007416_29230 [Kroppenstedtia guangzhouensis]